MTEKGRYSRRAASGVPIPCPNCKTRIASIEQDGQRSIIVPRDGHHDPDRPLLVKCRKCGNIIDLGGLDGPNR